jgi:hypothetical protein
MWLLFLCAYGKFYMVFHAGRVSLEAWITYYSPIDL